MSVLKPRDDNLKCCVQSRTQRHSMISHNDIKQRKAENPPAGEAGAREGLVSFLINDLKRWFPNSSVMSSLWKLKRKSNCDDIGEPNKVLEDLCMFLLEPDREHLRILKSGIPIYRPIIFFSFF